MGHNNEDVSSAERLKEQLRASKAAMGNDNEPVRDGKWWADQFRAGRRARLADPNTSPFQRKMDEAHERHEAEEREAHQREVAKRFDEFQQEAQRREAQQPKPKREASIPNNVTPDTLLTLDQAAAVLNVTDEQIIGFVQDGVLPYINVGRGTKRARYRFKKQDLDNFVNDRRQKEIQCLSPERATRRSTTTTSDTKVVGFIERRNAQLAAKPKPSKP